MVWRRTRRPTAYAPSTATPSAAAEMPATIGSCRRNKELMRCSVMPTDTRPTT